MGRTMARSGGEQTTRCDCDAGNECQIAQAPDGSLVMTTRGGGWLNLAWSNEPVKGGRHGCVTPVEASRVFDLHVRLRARRANAPGGVVAGAV
jgi:hypothetical protein